MRSHAARYGLSLLLWLPFVPAEGQTDAQVVATGLNGPVKLDVTRRGNLVVTERGGGENDGRLSRVGRSGNVQVLLSGLPSGIEVTGAPSGPQGVVLRGCCVVDLTIGEGNTLRFDPNTGPPRQVPNPVGPASPLFSAVLRLTFNYSIDELTNGFSLTRADHDVLADGFTVRLENDSGEKLWVALVEDLKDYRPDPFTNVRNVNPFSITHGSHHGDLVVADSGQNGIVEIEPFGPPQTRVRFAPVQNPPGVFPPFSDAVPTSVFHLHGSKYLVGLLVGVPFRPGTASVRLVDLRERTESVLISGRTSIIEVLAVHSDIYVLEISSNLSQGAPGQLLRFSSPSATPEPLATGLIGPSGMAFSRRDEAIYIAEIFAGQIRRVDLDLD